MSNNFNIIGLFPIPIIKIKFKDHYKYRFPEVEKRDNRPDSWNCSVYTTFPDINADDPLVPYSIQQNLKNDLITCITNVFQQLNFPINIHIPQFWYNIYHDNQGQEEHHHLPQVGQASLPFWSGIYYNKNASPTNFKRTDFGYLTQSFPNNIKSELAPAYAESYSPDVEDGDIVLFPPYLPHNVKSLDKHKDEMRMTFSFNIELK